MNAVWKRPQIACKPLDSLQVMYENSDDAFCLRKPWQATSTLKLTVLTRYT
ncbi:hypothetical protein YC2023_002152 [Brassica napus]